ncbi:MAG TPA: nitrate- and nitrite sensing domain-containing protein [Acidimicrobiales bacterium]|nr:nitrate- and nitrite sensing domain-containing protein [Acidimicrobiales bacterium]
MRIPLRTKLTLLLAIPLLVLVAAAAREVQNTTDDAQRGDAATSRVELSLAATTAALELAQERALSASLLSATKAPPAAPPDSETAEDLASQRDRTSDAIDALRATITGGRSELGTAPALDQLDRLAAAREQVDQRGEATSDDVLGAYAEIIDPVLDLDRAVELAGSAAMMTRLDSFQALSRALQEVVVEQGLLTSAFASGTVNRTTYDRLRESVTSQSLWFDQFARNADSAQLDHYAKALAQPAVTTSLRLRDQALAAGPDGQVHADPAAWANVMERKTGFLETIADDTAGSLADSAAGQRELASDRRTRALLVLGITVALSVAVLVLLYRTAIRPLRRLTLAADHAVHVALPAAVEVAQNEGAEAARRALTPLPLPADGDLAELTAAFNEAQTAALALASDEAELRTKVNAVFLNFGHRTQDLVTRQLGHIDDLEARTEDPDTLSDLFLLDHLSTRLRRNAESLVVMAGADSPRPWSRPVSVVNVVRAAVAEAVDYSRVDVDSIDPGAIVGIAANDVSHLLAELVDNALAFSASGTRVRIAGGWVDEGRYLVTVTSAGAGMNAGQLDEANERISGSNVSDPGMSRYFGMFVVGRFARRHGIDVRLMPARGDGTTAEVLLPEQLMVGAVAECQTTPGR